MKIHMALMRGREGAANQLKISRGAETIIIYVNSSELAGYLPLPLDERLLRLRLSDIQGYMKLKFRVREKNGVIVTKVYKDGIGNRYGLHAGDVILKINNQDVEDTRQFQTLLAEGLRTNYILFQVNRKNEVFFVPMKLDSLI
jgi:S1-C subfamily serine protease